MPMKGRKSEGSLVWLSKAAAKMMAEKQKKGAQKARRKTQVELVDIALHGCCTGEAVDDDPNG